MILTIVTFAQKWPLLTMRHVLEEVVFKGVFKKVNPNNSVNIEIKGGSGAGGGSKKNGVPPSPAASKKVHKYASKKYSSKNCASKKFHINKYVLQSIHHHHHPHPGHLFTTTMTTPDADARCNASVSFCSEASRRPGCLQTLPEEFCRGSGMME